ncbi:MAG: FG-GAP repeat protein [Ignavibacteria bacterium]|nr:FG-GAP repeat protein [Ignavibacteria bacterium]
MIVGTYRYSSFTGRAYIYFGGLTMNTVADVTFTGENINNNFGYSVSSAGDVNGDGYSDVIIGAHAHSSNTGKAYIYFGGATMNNDADITMTGETTSDNFGYSVSSAGNVNNDGCSDVIIGAYGHSTNTGRAYIYFGGLNMNTVADVIMTGESANDYFGISVSSAGDVNGGGYSDVIVSAFAYNAFSGRTYIYFGATTMDNTADVTMTGESASDLFGASVSAGNVNGDAFSDVIVGAYGYATSTGRVYIYLGGTQMNNTADVTMTGESTGDRFGRSVSSAVNINGDVYSDVIVGADIYFLGTGRTYIFFGGVSMNNISDLTMTSEATGNFFGVSVSSAGDVTGDGRSDVIVGAEGYSANTGRAYLYDYFSGNGTINLTIIIEGFYNSTTNTMIMNDMLTVYLRNSSSPFAIIDSARAVINSSTLSGSFQITNAPNGTYYIQTKHRNTIETWSTSAISYIQGSTSSYNFITASTQAFGKNMIQVDASPVRFAIFSGDVNHDGHVDLADIIIINNDASNFITGYVNSDVTGNSILI